MEIDLQRFFIKRRRLQPFDIKNLLDYELFVLSKICESKGIRLIHIWGHEWKTNKEFIKTLITLYLEDKVHQNEFQKLLEQFNGILPRDYFSTLDFEGKLEELQEEFINNNLKIYKTGRILIEI